MARAAQRSHQTRPHNSVSCFSVRRECDEPTHYFAHLGRAHQARRPDGAGRASLIMILRLLLTRPLHWIWERRRGTASAEDAEADPWTRHSKAKQSWSLGAWGLRYPYIQSMRHLGMDESLWNIRNFEADPQRPLSSMTLRAVTSRPAQSIFIDVMCACVLDALVRVSNATTT